MSKTPSATNRQRTENVEKGVRDELDKALSTKLQSVTVVRRKVQRATGATRQAFSSALTALRNQGELLLIEGSTRKVAKTRGSAIVWRCLSCGKLKRVPISAAEKSLCAAIHKVLDTDAGKQLLAFKWTLTADILCAKHSGKYLEGVPEELQDRRYTREFIGPKILRGVEMLPWPGTSFPKGSVPNITRND